MYSRYFRDAFGLEFYVRKLAKHGVKLVSMTQELGDDPAQVMMRQVISLFDEYQSKENANWLNCKGYRTRQGGMWSIGTLHQLLINPVYGGRWCFNHVDSRTRRRKAGAAQIFSDVPAIIAPEHFANVQALLKGRNPRIAEPRSVTGPILPTGLAFCSLCDGAMTLPTGTSKS